MRDRVILVTGAASGMGRGCVELFAREGAKVAFVDVAEPALRVVEKALAAEGRTVYAAPVDIADEQAVGRLVGDVRERWGGVDGLVHCAAILRYGGILETDAATWDAVQHVNLRGAYVVNRAVARAMVDDGRKGAIVNISSIASTKGLPGLAAYSASKGGVSALTRSMAIELLPHGIRVNAICPGFVESGMTRELLEAPGARENQAKQTAVGRVCGPEDIAKVAAHLLSDAADFITGQSVYVDSGVSVR